MREKGVGQGSAPGELSPRSGGLPHRIPGMLFQAGGDFTRSSASMACKLFLALQNPVLKVKPYVDLLKENPQTKLLG